MTTPATRPRVRLSAPAIEPPPMWWERLWHDRQSRIRGRLLPWLAEHGRPMTASELRQGRGLNCWRDELEWALDRLVESGVLRRYVRKERRICNHRGAATCYEFTYYALPEWPEPEPAGPFPSALEPGRKPMNAKKAAYMYGFKFGSK
jgi:hypothetical protein